MPAFPRFVGRARCGPRDASSSIPARRASFPARPRRCSSCATPTLPGNPEQLLAQASAAYDAAQAALRAGDLGTYQAKLTQAYQLAAQAASLATGSPVTAVQSDQRIM